jgi:uncharacterized membrane protein YhaH (DUF805 family)
MESVANAIRQVVFLSIALIIAGFALAIPTLRGKGWIAAWAACQAITMTWYGVLNLLLGTKVIEYARYSQFMAGVPIIMWLSAAGMACLLLFVVSQRAAPKVDFIRLFFSFQGRISRQSFWIGSVVLGVIGWISSASYIGVLASTQRESGSTGQAHLYVAVGVYVLWSLASIWPALALQAKRWHDRDKSAWMILVNFIPLVGAIWSLVELGFLAGTPQANAYGEDPLQPADSPLQGDAGVAADARSSQGA